MKVLIKFTNDYIQFYDYADYKIAEYSRTNVLDLKEIVLSDTFVKENYNFIYNFIRNKIIKDNINKVFIDNCSINKLVFLIINNIENLNYVYIKENKKIDTEIFKYILNSKYVRYINCYDINPITFNRLNLSRKIKIITRKKVCDNTYLYRLNGLNTYSDIYYKESIVIDKLLSKKDLTILNDFLKNNRDLKYITIKYFDKDNLNKILKCLEKNKCSSIRINIIENDSNVKSIIRYISDIKKKHKRYLKKNKVNIKVMYEDKYIRKNIFKELNLKVIKTTLLGIIVVTTIIYVSLYFITEKHTKNTLKTNEKINDLIHSVELKEPVQPKITDENIKTDKPEQKSAYFQSYSKAITELKKVNKDTVGWLTLNHSKINYPVVKSNNNSKYLNKSFDGTPNPNGWIFMDYRSNPANLGRNTIIYGHSGNYYVMFGSLKDTLKPSWYKNVQNQIITFNTETNSKKWHIYSIYTIGVTSDYLITTFKSDENYLNFLNKTKERSIYDFGQDLTINDKVLTLSTCYKDGSERLVIHAKLMQ